MKNFIRNINKRKNIGRKTKEISMIYHKIKPLQGLKWIEQEKIGLRNAKFDIIQFKLNCLIV